MAEKKVIELEVKENLGNLNSNEQKLRLIEAKDKV